jgi:hypothetical protein
MTVLIVYLPLVSLDDVAKLRSALGQDFADSIFPQLITISEPDRLRKALLVVADLGLSNFVLVFDQLPEKSVTERAAIDAVMSSAEFLDMKRAFEAKLDDIVIETRELELCWVVRATSIHGGIPPGDAYLVDKRTKRVFQHRWVDVANLYPRYPAPDD